MGMDNQSYNSIDLIDLYKVTYYSISDGEWIEKEVAALSKKQIEEWIKSEYGDSVNSLNIHFLKNTQFPIVLRKYPNII